MKFVRIIFKVHNHLNIQKYVQSVKNVRNHLQNYEICANCL